MNPSRKFSTLTLFLPLAMLLAPTQAWALQSHGPPEGIYVHQLAHLFYAAALAYFCWDIGRSSFPGRGWRYLQLFCVFMISWNLLAFSGHWLGFYIQASDVVSPHGYLSKQIVGPITTIKVIYFFATLDHILSVPALFCLFLSMRALYHSSGEAEKK